MNVARILVVCLLLAATASAQRPGGRGQGRGAGRMQDPRAQLEDDVRREFSRVVRERVGLSDDQMQKLGPLTQKYEQQRRQTQMDERNTRIRLQAALLDSNPSDSTRINQFLQQLLDVQKRRVAIAEAEQNELGTIMNAHQRARYLGLQEQVRRRLEQMRPFPGGPPDGPGPGGGRQPGNQFGRPPGDSSNVRLAVSPMRGSIAIDGVERGKGRLVVTLPFGWHKVAFSAEGCDSAQDSILVNRGSAQVLSRSLSGKAADCK